MKPTIPLLLCLALLVSAACADDHEETVPRSVEGGSARVKSGGKTIGEGFRDLGRGIGKTFKGEASADSYKQGGKELGEGFRNLGTGTAGVSRGVGVKVKEGFTGSKDRPTEPPGGKLNETNLDER